MKTIPQGFVLKCTEVGEIQAVIKDDLKIVQDNKSLLSLIDPLSITKTLSFLTAIKTEGSSLGWEVNIQLNGSFQSFFLAGIKEKETLIIIGTRNRVETRHYFNELMKISNQQNNQLRKAIKESVQSSSELKKSEAAFNQLTELNNEMVNMQRELAKKNIELQQLNKELEQKNKELDQFAYMITHDLKAPLIGISSVMEFVKMDHWDELPEEVQEMFVLISQRTDNMKELINGILAYARAGEAEAEQSTFHLLDLFKDILGTLALSESFLFHLPQDAPTLNGSYIQLNQVLSNLMGNAVKYHDKTAGNIYINIEPSFGDLLRFLVRDDGPGIPDRFKEDLFEPFVTAHGTKRSDSTGIGLSIVKKLVTLNGGEIGFDSVVGEGTTFWFTWPQNRL